MSQPTSLRDPKRNCTEPPFHEKARDAPGRGRAVALAFAREGADVAIAYLNEHEDANETKRIVEEAGRGALLIAADFADLKDCARLVDETVKAFGRIDILVNNAAFQGKVTESFAESGDRRGAHRALVPRRHHGDATTKGAIVTFTKGLAQEVIKKGICANTVAPGPVWTPFIVQSFAEKEIAEKEIAEFGKDSVMGRPAQPAELAPAYVFLASNESKDVNGEVSVSLAASRSADRHG